MSGCLKRPTVVLGQIDAGPPESEVGLHVSLQKLSTVHQRHGHVKQY